MNLKKSKRIFQESKRYMPGGVNSPVRAFNSVIGIPPVIERGEKNKIYDIDGNEYIDFVCSWGPLILGHCNKRVVKAVKRAVEKGMSFGAVTENELILAKMICKLVPSIEKLRLVNSGTEAVMSAIRLARAYTGKKIIIKFEGCYHGHSDSLLIKAGSGALTFGKPNSSGVLPEFAKYTVNLEYNNIDMVNRFFKENHRDIAGVIVEPVAGNMGVIVPDKEFLQGLREITKKYRSLLIFDEIITGLRIGLSGAQGYFKIKPDITTLGKILGGGMPLGAYGASKEIMSKVSPEGDMYQAGTLSGNPCAVAAGIETLKILIEKKPYKKLENLGRKAKEIILQKARKKNLKIQVNQIGSMFTIFFTDKKVYNFRTAATTDTKKYALWHNKMLKRGLYFAPSAYEAAFLSTEHKLTDIQKIDF